MGFQECIENIKDALQPEYVVHLTRLSTNPQLNKDIVILLDDIALVEEGPNEFLLRVYVSLNIHCDTLVNAYEKAKDIIQKLLKAQITCHYTFADVRVTQLGQIYGVSIILEIKEEVN